MYKSSLALAVAVGVLAQQAGAAGFIEDSKASVSSRTFYYNADTREGTANDQKETAQGFKLDYTSGFTEGLVGFGIDAGLESPVENGPQRVLTTFLKFRDRRFQSAFHVRIARIPALRVPVLAGITFDGNHQLRDWPDSPHDINNVAVILSLELQADLGPLRARTQQGAFSCLP